VVKQDDLPRQARDRAARKTPKKERKKVILFVPHRFEALHLAGATRRPPEKPEVFFEWFPYVFVPSLSW